MPDLEEYKQWIQTASTHDVVEHLNDEVKEPLVSAQNLVNMLVMMQNPSPAVQKKIDSGELNAAEMLNQITDLIKRSFDSIDFFREALDE